MLYVVEEREGEKGLSPFLPFCVLKALLVLHVPLSFACSYLGLKRGRGETKGAQNEGKWEKVFCPPFSFAREIGSFPSSFS